MASSSSVILKQSIPACLHCSPISLSLSQQNSIIPKSNFRTSQTSVSTGKSAARVNKRLSVSGSILQLHSLVMLQKETSTASPKETLGAHSA